MYNISYFYYGAKNWKERLMEWESRTRGDHVKKLLMRVSYPYCNIGLPRSPIRFREQTMKRRGPYGAANLKFKWEEHLEKDHLNAACAALKLTLPEPFQILLHDGMNYHFPVEDGTSQVTKGFTNLVNGARVYDGASGVQVHDWVSVCLSSNNSILRTMTPEEFKLFIEDVVCKGEAIGMDFFPRPRCSLWPRLFAPTDMSIYQLEDALVLAELLALLRCLAINGKIVQLVLIVVPDFWDVGCDSLRRKLHDLISFCKEYGVIYHQCSFREVRMRNEFVDETAREIMRKAIHLDCIKTQVGSKELRLDAHALGSLNVSVDETQDEEQGGDGGSEHESSTHGDGFPGSVDEEESEDCDDKTEKVCEKLGFVYQRCSPEDATNPSKVYLKTVASEINDKVVKRDADVLPRNFVMPFSAKEDDPTIVFGADIFRDSNISVASVVATFDWPVSSRYSAFFTEQQYEEVTIKNLHNENEMEKSMVRRSLFTFFNKTNKWPCRIIFFRNGVDEGQLSFILSREIDAIQKACTSIFKSTLLITYVVVGGAESAVGDGSCCSAKFEFSCSHPVRGTGTNDVAYRVLHDENQYDADELQSLCINLYASIYAQTVFVGPNQRYLWLHPPTMLT